MIARLLLPSIFNIMNKYGSRELNNCINKSLPLELLSLMSSSSLVALLSEGLSVKVFKDKNCLLFYFVSNIISVL